MLQKTIRKVKRWAKRSNLVAISDHNLAEWLASLGILDKVENGEERCLICKEKVGISSIEIVTRMEGEIRLVCDKPECVYHFTKIVERCEQ